MSPERAHLDRHGTETVALVAEVSGLTARGLWGSTGLAGAPRKGPSGTAELLHAAAPGQMVIGHRLGR